MIHFDTTPFSIGSWNIVQLPKEASAQLPSRGIVMVTGTLNGSAFQTVLEPDGWGSHWFNLNEFANLKGNGSVSVEIELTKSWIEPELPHDIADALKKHAAARETWDKTTPQAHWEWIRWIRATNNTETRARRIEVACSKLKSGMRRPCCFNASACTVPEVSKNGALLTPEIATA